MNKVKKFLYSQKAAPYVFILPFVLTVILFWVFPIANGVLLSFQDVLKDKWVGMNNYKRLLSDTYFRKAVWNSFKYMVVTPFSYTHLDVYKRQRGGRSRLLR